MMNFGQIGLSEAQIDLLESAQKFCRKNASMDRVRALIESETGYDEAVWQQIITLGWLGIAIPENYGGAGLSLSEVVPVIEQMGRYMMHSPFVSTTLAAQAILRGGTDMQRHEILPEIVSGDAATLALCEAQGDWNLVNVEAQAVVQGDGYRLTGVKHCVMDFPDAIWIVVSVKIDDKTQLIILHRDDIPKAAYRRETLIDETKRGYELKLDGIFVAADRVMDTAKLADALTHIHLTANLFGAAEMTGACQSCIDYTVEYLGTRKQFGKLIGSFQALKHPTVDAFVDYQKAKSLLYSAAFSFGDEASGEIATRMAKVQTDKALSFAADRSIQFHGGFGFTYDCDAQLYRRRAIFMASQYGDALYHKQKLAEILFS